VRQVCAVLGLSRQAYYAEQRSPGREESSVRVRRSRPGPWATAEALEAGIRALTAAEPAWGVRKVWARLRRDGIVASRKRVWAMMHALGLVLPPVREREELAPRGQVVVPESNRRWATDLTTVWTQEDGLAAVVPVVDCGDREVLECEVTKSQESPAVLRPVERALWKEFGSVQSIPEGLELRSDHGPQYTGQDCEELCSRWGIGHTFAPVGRPTGNAVAERVIQTLKIELIWTRDWRNIAELEQAIRDWVVRYNTHRPHQALNWQTPAERRVENLAKQKAA
jgi:putative transposase